MTVLQTQLHTRSAEFVANAAAMQAVAQLNPMLHMNQAFKGVAAYGMGFHELRFELSFMLVFCCVSLALGIHSYRYLLGTDKS